MKAVVLREFGRPLAVEEVAEPEPGTGETVVDVVAAPVPHYTAEMVSGTRRYSLGLPGRDETQPGRLRPLRPDGPLPRRRWTSSCRA
ncbi:hypothetical protein [Amycolatopsis orientalis]|uniref:hypothetical protein n=1 Tax=Amycolatopsis orientalis TaxID=31958 RepID=UPI00068488A6|nr:hypothetical protein [Amycolatopsis orientalis]